MANNNELELILKFLVDKNSQASAQAAIKSLEQASIKLNQQTSSFGSSGISKSGSQTALQPPTSESVWTQVLDYADQYNVKVETAIQNLAKMGTTGLNSADEIKVYYEDQNRLFEQQDSAIRNTGDGLLGMSSSFDSVTKKANQTSTAIENIDKNTQNLTKNVGRYGSFGLLGITGFTLAMTGSQIQSLGKAGLSPITKYLNSLDDSEKASSEWVKNQEKIENSMVRIGGVMADELLPTFEKIADLAEQAADFVEKNPELAKSAATLFGGAIVGGGALAVFGNVLSSLASFGSLSLLMGGSASAGSSGIFSSLSAGIKSMFQKLIPTMSLSGLISGIGSYGVISKASQNEEYEESLPKSIQVITKGMDKIFGNMPELNQYLTVFAKGLGDIFGKGNEWAYSIGVLTGAIEKADKETKSLADTLPSVSQMEVYLDYYQDQQKALTEYSSDVAETTKSYNQELADLEKDYQSTRAEIVRSYQTSEAQYLKEYYLDRKQSAEDYAKELADLEEDHQQEMIELKRDHDETMDELTADRDALGIVREMRSYERQRKEKEEEYSKELKQRKSDYTLQMKQLAENFALQRQERLENYQLQLKEAAANYAEERKQATAQYKQDLKDLKDNYKKETQERREALKERLEDTYDALTQERLLRQKFSKAMLDDLQAVIDAATSTSGGSTTAKKRDSGGYMVPGLYRNATGSAEYALAPGTVSTLEKLAGGKLTQGTILQLAAGGLSRGGNVTYNDYSRYDGRITAADRRELRNEQIAMFESVLGAA